MKSIQRRDSLSISFLVRSFWAFRNLKEKHRFFFKIILAIKRSSRLFHLFLNLFIFLVNGWKPVAHSLDIDAIFSRPIATPSCLNQGSRTIVKILPHEVNPFDQKSYSKMSRTITTPVSLNYRGHWVQHAMMISRCYTAIPSLGTINKIK